MKRFHVHVAVKEVQESIRFYSAVFGTSPTVVADQFKYRPTVSGVSPNSGPAEGGTAVTVSGTGFQINNPNVVAACGCGSSFQAKDEADGTGEAVATNAGGSCGGCH